MSMKTTMNSVALKRAQQYFIKTSNVKAAKSKWFTSSVWFVGGKHTTLGNGCYISSEKKDQEEDEVTNANESNIYWVNPDQCGGEIRKISYRTKDSVKIDFTAYENDPMWPFLL